MELAQPGRMSLRSRKRTNSLDLLQVSPCASRNEAATQSRKYYSRGRGITITRKGPGDYDFAALRRMKPRAMKGSFATKPVSS